MALPSGAVGIRQGSRGRGMGQELEPDRAQQGRAEAGRPDKVGCHAGTVTIGATAAAAGTGIDEAASLRSPRDHGYGGESGARSGLGRVASITHLAIVVVARTHQQKQQTKSFAVFAIFAVFPFRTDSGKDPKP